jgi:hypothetical protein
MIRLPHWVRNGKFHLDSDKEEHCWTSYERFRTKGDQVRAASRVIWLEILKKYISRIVVQTGSMREDIVAGAVFPDYELTDHTGERRKLSELQGPDPSSFNL